MTKESGSRTQAPNAPLRFGGPPFRAALFAAALLGACSSTEKQAAVAPDRLDWPIMAYPAGPLLPPASEVGNRPRAAPEPDEPAPITPPEPPPPRIVAAGPPLQCVPYARRKSSIPIRGHAWTWWKAASGRFRRSASPEVGAVLVFKRNRRSRGHLAVVEHLLGPRVIVVSHANWLNRGRIHLNTPVRDVSRANDWSAVRVWYTPNARFGSGTYRTHGFIHADPEVASARLDAGS